jgi:hypothetical protein
VHSVPITIETRIDIFLTYGRELFNDGSCFAVLADLQVGVLQIVHRVNLVFGSDVHPGGLLCCCKGGQVGLNVFFPEAESGKNV